MPPRFIICLACLLALFRGGMADCMAEEARSAPASLRVVTDDNYPPFMFIDPEGKQAGYVADYWRLWEQRTGIKVHLAALPWSEAQRRLLAGEADVIDLIFQTPPREADYDFTAPYARVPVAIYAHASIKGFTETSNLKGFQIGVMAGDACIDMLRGKGIDDLREFASYSALIEGAKAGEVRLFCLDEYPANYYLYRLKAQNSFVKVMALYEGQFRRAVKKGNTEVLALVERGHAAIKPSEEQAMRAKWMPAQEFDYAPYVRPVGIALVILAGSLVLAFLWLRSLRVTVAEKTRLLQESEAQFRRLFEETRQAIVLLDDDRFAFGNQAALDLLGTDEAHLRGRTFADFSPALQPDGAPSANRANELIRVAHAEKSAEFEWTLLGRNGTAIIVDIQLTPLHHGNRKQLHAVLSDITERRRMEQELAEQRNRMEALVAERTEALARMNEDQEALFNAATAGIVYVRERQVIRCNHALGKIFGYEPGEMIGQSTRCWYPDEKTFLETGQRIHLSQRADSYFSDEIELVRKDGSRFWAHITAQAIDRNDLGKGIAGLIEDVTERRLAAEALQALSREQAAILESASAGIVLIANGSIRRCNRRADELLGYSPGEQIGNSTRRWFADDDAHNAATEAAYAAVALGDTFVRELELQRRDGKRIWIRASVHAITPEDLSQGVVAILTDISAERAAIEALKTSEEQQRAIFDSASSGIALIKDRTLIRANRSLHRIFGWPDGEMLGKRTTVWYPDAEAERIGGDPVYEVIWQGRPHTREQQLKRRDGTLFWARLTGTAVDAADHDKGSVWVIDDITTEHAAVADMVRARTLAEDATRMKSDFIANMSHEIRTPMNAIIGMTHLVLKTNLDRKQRDYLAKIQGSSQHLLGIINDILDFSKIEAGKLVVENTEFSLEHVLDTVIGQIAQRCASKGLELTIRIGSDVPPQLVGDPLRIGQVLINYASNAVKFTEQGEISIAVTAEDIGDGEALLRFSVADTGIGLSPEACSRLFKSFEQADSSTTRKYGGTGLGLAIAKRLAEMMGGSVGVDSVPGSGSTFWFTARVGIGHTQPNPLVPKPDLRGRRILVVDDNALARQVIREMLEAMTFAVGTADSAAGAEVELQRADDSGTPYDLALIDWKMPDIDGIAAARMIGKLPLASPPKLALITAHGHDAPIAEAIEIGVEHVLVKPLTPSSLFDTIVELLGEKREVGKAGEPSGDAGTGSHGSDFSGTRILLVEDNEMNQEVAVELLSQAGAQVDVAGNGEEALTILERERYAYDLVFMDMQMPVMDGISATREIRRRQPDGKLPIVAMTANAMQQDRERCLQAGMNDHLAKPIDPDALAAALRKWLKQKPEPAKVETVPPALDGATGSLPAITGIDTAQGLRNALGKERLYISLLKKFAASHHQLARDLAGAMVALDLPVAERLAHTLKSTAAQIGATEVSGLAASLESRLSNRDDSAESTALARKAVFALTNLVSAIESAYPEFMAPASPYPVDEEELRATLVRLAAMLAEDDFSASRFIEEKKALLQAAFPESFHWISEAISDFNNAAALDWLKEEAAKRGITL